MLLYSELNVTDKEITFEEWLNKQFKRRNYTATQNQLKFIKVLSDGGFIITKSYRQSGMSTMIVMYICYNLIYGNFEHVAIVGTGQNNTWYRAAIKEYLSNCDEELYVKKDDASDLVFLFKGAPKSIQYIPYSNISSRVCERKFDFIAIDNAAFLPKLEQEVLFLRTCTNHMLLASCPNPIEEYDFKTIYNSAIRRENKWKAYSFSWYMDTKKYPKIIWLPKSICASTPFVNEDYFINDEYRTEDFAMSMYSDGYIACIDMDVHSFGDNVECEIYGNFK